MASRAMLIALIRATNVLLGLVLAIILARLLGADGYGIYAFAISISSILAIPCALGLPKLVVRETSKGEALSEWPVVRGIWRWASMIALGSSLVILALAIVIFLLFPDLISDTYRSTVIFSVLLIPFTVFGNLRGAALRGLHHVALGLLPESIIRPGLLIIMITGAYWFTNEMAPEQAMFIHILAAAIAFVLGALLLYILTPHAVKSVTKTTYHGKLWIAALLPLALTSGLQQINRYVDILIIGAFKPAADVGLYRIALQAGTLVIFALAALGSLLAPHFASLHAKKDTVRLQNLVTVSSQASFLLAILAGAFLVIYGKGLLAYFVGDEFVPAYSALCILIIGQTISAFFGATPLLLNMTGFQNEAARSIGISIIANIVLNLFLVPPFGIIGAATATSASLIFWNLLLWRAVDTHLKIDSMALRFYRR